ncbi:DUF3592 domain-containing protein [Actinoplanes derwentensis]|nr:DUF3592 domain-containing protein [Actinoplanes derwentensis]
MSFGVGVWFLLGLFLIAAAMAQAVKTGRLGRDGLRAAGSVVRIEQSPDGRSLYSPVIAYTDETGAWREFTVGLKAFKPIHPVGARVPVRWIAGRPESASLSSVRHTVLMIGVPLIVGVACLAAGLWSMD